MQKLILLILLCCTFTLSAQKNPYSDLVYLKNGSILKCKIIDFKPEANIKVEIQGGSVLVYAASDVLTIERNQDEPKIKNNKSVHFYENSLYYSLFVNFSGGYKETPNWWGGMTDVPTLGFGLKFSAGKAFNRHLMLGAGLGWSYLDNFFMYSSHIPLFAEIRGDILKKNSSLYYVMALGYDFALMRSNSGWNNGLTMTDAKGGIYIQPALGLRFASASKSHFCIEINYAIHKASYSYLGNNGEMIGPTNNLFMRPALSLGMLF